MAETFDVSGRLAQGRPAVEAMSEYVWASHQVGFTDSDLTLHPGQVRDWYSTEFGMDLVVLQRDCASVDAAVRATREALVIQDDQVGVLAGAWQGSGAQAARQFLHRHGAASAMLADALATAATALRRTLDELWRAVDSKVETTIGVESDVGAAREQWLAAATTVTSGVGDRVAAAELVDGEVKPFVQNRIGADWLTAVQGAGAAVAEAYRTATAEISGRPPADFEIPGELGPAAPAAALSAAAPAGYAAPAVTAPTAPAAWAAPPAAASQPPVPSVPSLAPSPPGAAAPEISPPLAPPAAAPLSDLGLGGGGAGGAMPAVGQRFADALSGLLGGGTSDPAISPVDDIPGDDSEPPEPPELDDEEDEPEDEPDGEDEVGEEPDDEDSADQPGAEPIPAEPVPAEPEPEAAAPLAPTPPPPPAEALPPIEERTPCEIAADEVPQVGPPPATEPGGG